MATCDLTTGRTKACASVLGGIKNVYFSTDDIGAVTMDVTNTDTVVTLAGTPEYFKYQLVGSTNTLTETVNRDINMGTSFWSQLLSITLPKQTISAHKELKLLVYSTNSIICEDYNGNFFMMGLENGCTANGGSFLSGDARGSLNGYTLTFIAEEKKPANFIHNAGPPITGVIEDTTATVSAVQESP